MQNYLSVGLELSEKRCREKSEGMLNQTMAALLSIPRSSGGDFALEVWVNAETGRQIMGARSGPLDDLKDMFGDTLFPGLRSSLARQREEETGTTGGTNALKIHCEGNDFVIVLFVAFDTGMLLWNNFYPTTPVPT